MVPSQTWCLPPTRRPPWRALVPRVVSADRMSARWLGCVASTGPRELRRRHRTGQQAVSGVFSEMRVTAASSRPIRTLLSDLAVLWRFWFQYQGHGAVSRVSVLLSEAVSSSSPAAVMVVVLFSDFGPTLGSRSQKVSICGVTFRSQPHGASPRCRLLPQLLLRWE